MQYATQTNYIRHLSANHYRAPKLLCQYSNNLYSKALYQTRQPAFNEGGLLSYETNYHLCKTNDTYKMLQAGVAKHTMKVVAPSLRAFPCIIGKMQERRLQVFSSGNPTLPDKGGMVPLILSTNGLFKLPVSRRFMQAHPDMSNIRILVLDRLNGHHIKGICILPERDGSCFKIQYVFETQQQPPRFGCKPCRGNGLGSR